METPAMSLSDCLAEARLKYEEALVDYYRLSTCSELSEEDADQLAAIYEKADADPWLSFLVNELDFMINERIGLLDLKHEINYKNQQSWLREHLQEVPFDSQYRKEMQELLKEFKYYAGPIDGVWGKRSGKAIKKLHKEAQKRLNEEGFYDGKIDGVFAEYSITAVKQFQKAKHIKVDGVLGKETLKKLMKCGDAS